MLTAAKTTIEKETRIMGKMQEADEIDLLELFYALKKRILLIILIGLLFGCLSSVYTRLFVAPVYTSSATMLVLTKETTLASVSDLQIGTKITSDYSVLINSRPVLQAVVDNLGLDMNYKTLRSSITVTNPEDTRVLQLSVNNGDAELAKQIVDELAAVSSEYIGDQMDVVPPKIIEEGEIPTSRTSPSMSRAAMMGVLAGVMLTCGIICVMTIMDDTIKNEEDITKYLGISTLSSVPDRRDYINVKKSRRENQEGRERRLADSGRTETRRRERRERRS